MIQTGASSAPLPSRTTRRLPVLEAFSLMAAACAALTFLPYIVHSGTSAAPVRCAPSLLHYIVATAGFHNPQCSSPFTVQATSSGCRCLRASGLVVHHSSLEAVLAQRTSASAASELDSTVVCKSCLLGCSGSPTSQSDL